MAARRRRHGDDRSLHTGSGFQRSAARASDARLGAACHRRHRRADHDPAGGARCAPKDERHTMSAPITPDPGQILREVRLALQHNDYPAAISGLESAVKLARESGDLAAEGRHLGNLALIFYRLGQRERALRYFDRALSIARSDEDRLTEAGLLGNIGNVLREMGRFNEAVDYLNRALLIAQEIGDDRGRGIWLGNLGLVHDDLNQPQQAIPLHEQSIVIARRLRDQRGLAARLGNLGNSYVTLNDLGRALTYFEEAAALYRELDEPVALAQRLGVIGNLHTAQARAAAHAADQRRHLRAALVCYRETLALAVKLGDEQSTADLQHVIDTLAPLAEEGNGAASRGADHDASARF
ncbi:tetratricopeptide repeat protein [Anaerolineae bacterium CFX9]|nr:tetratricopeptide repeat protein [Anaerolineae bacterium CFX9]